MIKDLFKQPEKFEEPKPLKIPSFSADSPELKKAKRKSYVHKWYEKNKNRVRPYKPVKI